MKSIITFFSLIFFSLIVDAQAPNQMSFQAVVRDANGALVTNSIVGIQISILQNSSTGSTVYTEVHAASSNANGLVTIEIGNGALLFGNFSTINWANGPYFIKTETDPLGGFNYTVSGTSQLMSVPFSLYSKFAEATNETDPIFINSVAGGITNSDITYWNNKLDVELDGDPANELQSITISNDTIFLSNGGFIILPNQTNGFNGQYSNLLGAPVNVSFFINDAGYLTTEIDGSITNEIQSLSLSNDTLYLTSGGFVILPTGFDGQYSSLVGAPTNVSSFNNDAGYIAFEVDGSITNEIQALTISNDTLFLSNGGFAVLPSSFDGQYSNLSGAPTSVSFFVNDAGYLTSFTEIDGDTTNEIQALTISSDTIFLTNGGFVKLPTAAVGFNGQYSNLTGAPTNVSFFVNDAGYLTSFTEIDGDSTNEIQAISISNDTIYLSDGGFAVLPASSINWDNDSTNEIQTLTISNDTMYLSNGGFAVLPSSTINLDNDSTNELQVISISNDTLFLSNGGYAVIPSSGTEWSKTGNIGTINGASFIGTTDNQDLDFRTNDTIRMRVTSQGQLEFLNTGNSIFIGEGAGANDDLTNNRNVFIGNNSGSDNSTGGQNSALGHSSMLNNTTGYNNVAAGFNSLKNNTTGLWNTATGSLSLESNSGGSSNTALGFSTLRSLNSGQRNTAIGAEALSQSTSGGNNIAIGYRALYYSTSSFLTAVGNKSLYYNTTGTKNSALGYQSLYANTTGSENTAIGHSSLLNNSTGYRNTATGFESLKNNTTGKWNTANGVYALIDNTTGSNNTGVGYKALFLNTTGYENTAVGAHALNDNTTGHWNTANGYGSLEKNTTGSNNIALGSYSLNANTTGNYNTSIGHASLYNNTIGLRNTATGYYSLHDNTTGSYNVAQGAYAMNKNTTGYRNTAIGVYSLNFNTTGYKNTSNGAYAMYRNTTGHENTASGSQALYNNTTGNNNAAFGYLSLTSNTTGSNNSSLGSNVLENNTTGSNNTASGFFALNSNTTGQYNSAFGAISLSSNTTGSYNSSIGFRSLNLNTSGDHNTAHGYYALRNNTTGDDNSAIGFEALINNTTGYNSTAIGYQALEDNTIGYSNTAVGWGALKVNTIGNHNVAVGTLSFFGSGNTNATNSSAFGYLTGISASNQIRLGNSAVSSIGGDANWTNVSDARFKTNVTEDIVGLDFIMKLRPVSYHLDMDAFAAFYQTPDSVRLLESEALKAAEIQTGFIAQEVEEAAQSVGFEFHGVDAPKNVNDHYGLRYAEFVVPMVKAMQEQQVIIEKQQNKIKSQEEIIAAMLKRLEALEGRVGL